jgi:hypothetical protein
MVVLCVVDCESDDCRSFLDAPAPSVVTFNNEFLSRNGAAAGVWIIGRTPPHRRVRRNNARACRPAPARIIRAPRTIRLENIHAKTG